MRFLLVPGLLLAALLIAEAPVPGPVQPIPYSHALHAGKLQLKCAMCHENKDPGETMGIPAAAKCMMCHQAVKTDAEPIQKLKTFFETKREIPWVRVYQIPSYVFFSHRAHTETGTTCQECHGSVTTSEVLKRETDISMGGCMTCHRQKKAPLNCTFCHEQRN
ncbi:MAG: cytochrome c3 family protein [Acidobacteria bacterium]|nr:cytochrome c3 family protein [Acidobacteriota bacterium]